MFARRRTPPIKPEPASERGTARSLFFNRIWLVGAALLLLVGILSRETALSLLALLVFATAGFGSLWNTYALSGIEYERTLSRNRAFPGDELVVTISLVNRKPLPVPWLSIEDEFSETLKPLDRETIVSGTSGRRVLRIITNVRPYQRVTWRVPVRCPTRGVQTLGPVVIRAGDPFGFFANRKTVYTIDQVLVYPLITPLADLGFPARLALGETRVPRHLITDPSLIVGVRDYQPIDPFKTIHWKASARQQKLQVRIAEPTTTLQIAVFLNLDTFEHYWEGLDVITAEGAIEVAASVVARASEQKYSVGVYANGVVAGSDQPLRVPPGRGPEQLARALEGLAKISPYSTVTFGPILKHGTSRLAPGSTVVVVSSMLPEVLVAQLLGLIKTEHRVVMIPIGEIEVPPIRGLIVRPVNILTRDPIVDVENVVA